MQLQEWNRLQRGDIVRYEKVGAGLKRRKAIDRTIIRIDVGSYGGRYVVLSSNKAPSGEVAYPQAMCVDFILVRKGIDTARDEVKRISNEDDVKKVVQRIRRKNTATEVKNIDSKGAITVRFSVSGVADKPINAEFTINPSKKTLTQA